MNLVSYSSNIPKPYDSGNNSIEYLNILHIYMYICV